MTIQNNSSVEAIFVGASLLAKARRLQAGSYNIERLNKIRGFTLVELIVIMVIIGILAVVALPRFFDNDAFQARGAADQVKAALRYGQKVAIAQRTSVSVNITSPTSTSDCGTTLTAGNVNCQISNKVTVADTTVTFNALGQPVPNAAVTISVGTGANLTTITVEAETGYVH